MKLKKLLLLLLCLICGFIFSETQAQNYYIDFTASGLTTTLDSVYVQNLTQGTSLTLGGSDTLHLIGTVDITDKNQNSSDIRIYPNPISESSCLEFYCELHSDATIDVYDAIGKHMLQSRQEVQMGVNIFEISGFPTGQYHIVVKAENWHKSKPFVSLSTGNLNPQISLKSTYKEEIKIKTTKSTKNTLQIPYTTGDQMRFIGYHDSIYVLIYDMPTSNKTIDFVFSTSSCGAILIDVRDGNQYPTLQIGSQCWMKKNLAYLPSVVDSSTGSQTTPFYYVYGYNDTVVADAKATSNYTTYGVLYNWSAAINGETSSIANPSGVQGICPTGWHLPSDAEWTQLTDYLGGVFVAGGKLKEAGYSHWVSPNTGATNETGFNGLPGGIYSFALKLFYNLEYHGTWWSTTETSATWAWYFSLRCDSIFAIRSDGRKDLGFSVRCVRD